MLRGPESPALGGEIAKERRKDKTQTCGERSVNGAAWHSRRESENAARPFVLLLSGPRHLRNFSEHRLWPCVAYQAHRGLESGFSRKQRADYVFPAEASRCKGPNCRLFTPPSLSQTSGSLLHGKKRERRFSNKHTRPPSPPPYRSAARVWRPARGRRGGISRAAGLKKQLRRGSLIH